MRILMLNVEYPPLGGGQGAANKALFDELNRRGAPFEVDVVTSSSNAFYCESHTIGSIFYLDIGKKGRNQHLQTVRDLVTGSAKTFRFARRLIKSQTYDLVVVWSGVPSGFLSYLFRLRYGVPYVIILSGPDVPFHEQKWRLADRLIFRWLSPWLWKKASFVVANSARLLSDAARYARRSNLCVIPNALNVSFFSPGYENRNPSRFVLLGTGRLSRVKGFDVLIRALALTGCSDIELWLAGSGPEKGALEQLAVSMGCKESVIFLGSLSKEQLVEVYRSADVFCLPSRNEGMSNALMEAMACGLPVVAARVGGTQELIDGNGYVVDCEDSQAMAQAILQFKSDNEARMLAGKKSREIALRFSAPEVANRFIDLFQQAITQGQK